MKLGRLNHVGVATPSIETSVALDRERMGAEVEREPFDLPAHDNDIVMNASAHYHRM